MALTSEHLDEDLWGALLEYIEQGTIVPVVGRDLLVVNMPGLDGQTTTSRLYSLIAADLAESLGMSVDLATFDGPNALGAVASEYIVQGGDTNRIYSRLPGIVSALNDRRDETLPQALLQLAAIKPFRVFVTTTFDPLLTDCLKAVRKVEPIVKRYAPGAFNELVNFSVGPDAASTVTKLEALGSPVIVHILGRLSSTPNYVVTEEDAFEFVYSLQETREGLFDLLAQMKLLILGCRFPSWLVRFFLRAVRRARLLQSSSARTDFVVDATASEDASLVQFLRTFKTHTEVFTGYQPSEFVAELSRRWEARNQTGRGPATGSAARHSIFLSYASEDAAAVRRIADEIATAPLPVWLDKGGGLSSGDEWSPKIKQAIDDAAAFVPILSRNCTSPERRDREFRKEWQRALERQMGLAEDDRFIHPLVIDDLDRDNTGILGGIRALQWNTLQSGGVGTDLMNRLRQAYRRAQLANLH